jgi:FKBP-type peptidyl-prolyl cis-trans isomerase 2
MVSMLVAGLAIGAGVGWLSASTRSKPPALPPPIAAMGDEVLIEYVTRLEDGSVVDDNRGSAPARFRLGDDRVLKGVERAVIGMRVGQSRQARVSPKLAFGERQPDKVVEVNRDRLRGLTDLQTGQRVRVESEDEQALTASILAVNDGSVTLDANHPLAGRQLVFDIRLLELTKQVHYRLRDRPD